MPNKLTTSDFKTIGVCVLINQSQVFGITTSFLKLFRNGLGSGAIEGRARGSL